LEIPQASLTARMGWFQNAYRRRINTRHRLWGYLLVEDTRRSWWSLEMLIGRSWTTFI
jgi:hypothetical protein